MQEKFSQRWEIYRLATHEKGGLHLVPLLSSKISYKQMKDMIEILDVYDCLVDQAYQENKAKAEKSK